MAAPQPNLKSLKSELTAARTAILVQIVVKLRGPSGDADISELLKQLQIPYSGAREQRSSEHSAKLFIGYVNDLT